MDSFEQTHISTAVPPLPEAELSSRPVRLAIAGFYRQMNQHLVRNRQLNEWILLLCTDGLTNALPAAKIEQLMAQTPFYDLPDRLIEAANDAGGQDNITAVLLEAEPAEVQHG